MFLRFGLLMATSLLFAAKVLGQQSAPIVKTSSGSVRGYYPISSVTAFLGIPYAQPPIGALRFEPPLPVTNQSDKLIDATEFGLSCPQWLYELPGLSATIPTTGNSEDCLTLNVWSAAKKDQTLKPVFVFMPGGGFTSGSTSVPLYSGLEFVKAYPDVMVVSLNYRLNIFGFANSPALPAKNVGLRDQRLALEWLRDNIAAFGGAPKRLVLGGQSAGAQSTSYYAYAYIEDPIVQGFIMESGSAETVYGDDGTQWKTVANATGCLSDDSSAELQCMRNLNSQMLRGGLSPYIIQPATGDPAYSEPTIDNITFFGGPNYPALGAAGKFAKLPTLRGITNNEGNGLTAWTPRGLVNQTLADLLTQYVYTCNDAIESAHWAAAGVPSWRYRYMAAFPSLTPYPWLKASHGSELALVFGTIRAVQGSTPDRVEIAAQKYLQAAWAAFIKDPYHGLENFGWPVYNPNGTALIELFNYNTANATIADSQKYDGPCEAIPS